LDRRPGRGKKLNAFNLRAIYIAAHKNAGRNRRNLTLLLFKNTLNALGLKNQRSTCSIGRLSVDV
jgi:hypothetical protein